MSLHEEILTEHRSWFEEKIEQRGDIKRQVFDWKVGAFIGGSGVSLVVLNKISKGMENKVKQEDMDLYGEYIATDATEIDKKVTEPVEPYIPEDDEPLGDAPETKKE